MQPHPFLEAFNGKQLSKSFLSSIINVLPKQQGLKEAKDFRRVSLLNMDQKILAHVLANRIKKIKDLVHDNQYAYIKGRTIHNALRDVKHRMTEKGTDWCLVGIVCEKACDRVDRKYMFQVLRKTKFPENFINIIENIYENKTASLIVNGYVSSKIKQTRGVRQGCPLSVSLIVHHSTRAFSRLSEVPQLVPTRYN